MAKIIKTQDFTKSFRGDVRFSTPSMPERNTEKPMRNDIRFQAPTIPPKPKK